MRRRPAPEASLQGALPSMLRSRFHADWAKPSRVAGLVNAGLLAQGDGDLLACSPGAVELVRHRALGGWARQNGCAGPQGHPDWHRLIELGTQ